MRRRIAAAVFPVVLVAFGADEPKLPPPQADETPLVRIKATPRNFVGRTFVLRGAVSISDYYNFGYAKAAKTHASFDLSSIDKDGTLERERGHY